MKVWMALAIFLGLIVSPNGFAQTSEGEGELLFEPKVERKQVDESEIDTEDFEIGVYAGMLSIEDFGVNPVYGARVAYHISEGLFLEAYYGLSSASETSFERLSSVELLSDSDRDLTYYNVSIGYNLLPGEVFLGRNRAFNSQIYIIGGVGNTTFAGDDRLTMNFGLGYRFLLNDWFSLHVDMRDHMFDIDVTGEDKTTHNFEYHLGAAFFF